MQLPQFRFSQKVRQLQLSDQDDLQQLRIMCFEIRNDSNLFECRERKVLSLVDDEDSPAFFLQNGNEKFIQRVQQVLLARRFRNRHCKVRQNRLHQIEFVQKRVQKESRADVLFDRVEHGAAQCRLAGADIAINNHEAFAPLYRVVEKFECAVVRLAAIEILRIGSEAEWRLDEAVILFVHSRRRVAYFRSSFNLS